LWFASVLDLSPVSAGSSGAVALRNSIDLAQFAERLGFHRYWVAEHHNLPSVASSAPEIMIGQIAAATSQIRVGSGGVMLPNHAPLMVRSVECWALFPDASIRLGRAPGTDPSPPMRCGRRDPGRRGFPQRFRVILFEQRLPGKPPLPPRTQCGRRAAADLVARIERLQRRARGRGRGRLCVRASFRGLRRCRRHDELREQFKPADARARLCRLACAAACGDSDASRVWSPPPRPELRAQATRRYLPLTAQVGRPPLSTLRPRADIARSRAPPIRRQRRPCGAPSTEGAPRPMRRGLAPHDDLDHA
jgi:hypothetical protein